ncbi:hypothetical protein ZTR_10064 [Talaromyces verruculosus]|nr:hypothetical protein ZTR_10064 [Talaromyces verruculosus]
MSNRLPGLTLPARRAHTARVELQQGGPAHTSFPPTEPTTMTAANFMQLILHSYQQRQPKWRQRVQGIESNSCSLKSSPPDANRLVAHAIIFPNLFEITKTLLRYLKAEKDANLIPFNYPQLIDEKTIKETAEELVSFIDPEIRELQGETITASQLLQVKNLQSQRSINWKVDGRYLNFITDDRNPDYFRAYVGQSKFIERRKDCHIDAMIADNNTTLHYHVSSRGNGYHHPHFIQLWKTGHDEIGEFYDQTLLTLSLPPTVLQEYFELANIQQSTMLGLNIVPPLYQTVSLGQEVRRTFMILCEESVDQDIKDWPNVRTTQQKKYWDPAKTPRVITSEDYVEAMERAVEKNQHLRTCNLKITDQGTPSSRKSDNIEEWFAALGNGLEMLSDKTPQQIPFGTLEAKIGVIFNQVYRKETEDGATGLPYGIRQSGFNETNVLAWP